jgi:hypothetical protein
MIEDTSVKQTVWSGLLAGAARRGSFIPKRWWGSLLLDAAGVPFLLGRANVTRPGRTV